MFPPLLSLSLSEPRTLEANLKGGLSHHFQMFLATEPAKYHTPWCVSRALAELPTTSLKRSLGTERAAR